MTYTGECNHDECEHRFISAPSEEVVEHWIETHSQRIEHPDSRVTDARIFDAALTPEQIRELYEQDPPEVGE